jgi:hypothetical protein
MRTGLRIFIVSLLLVPVSCSGKDKKEDDKKGADGGKKGDDGGKKGASESKDLESVASALLKYYDDNEKPAKTVDDLKPYLKKYPETEAYVDKIKSGDVVPVWGVTTKSLFASPGGPGAYVILYEKDADTKGGYVVTGDMKAKKVTAEEFKALKLAPTGKK